MRVLAIVVVGILVSALARAADPSPLDDSSLPGRGRYDRCLELIKRNPHAALGAAVAWQNAGGGGAAMHCSAMALIDLKRYPAAAGVLDQLGHQNIGGAEQRASVFDQAGNAWLLAHRGGDAAQSFSAALALSPRDPDLHADRARAAALLGDWKAAEDDLSTALALDPNRADLLVLRASARHALHHLPQANADLQAALGIVPNYPEALLERGTWKLEAGDAKGARGDWQAVVSRAPASAAGETARQRLSALAPGKGK
jgi:tetratricopeptide (TPR) repeat protein